MNDDLLSLCRRLIAIPSVTGEGTRRIAEFCATELLAPIGISAGLIPSPGEGGEQVNLVALIEGHVRNALPLVLNTHLDSVPPGDSALWTECGGDAFKAVVNDDRIYGLGSADTKLDLAAKITALMEVGKPRRDVYLVGTFGEEHGLVGAKEVAAAAMLPRGALAFVGEPSHLHVITAHKGLMAFEMAARFAPLPIKMLAPPATIEVAGRAAHSSTPALGINAIKAAFAAIAKSPNLAVLSINGGDAVNKVPARCEVVFAEAQDASAPSSESKVPPEALAVVANFIAALEEYASRNGPDEPDYAAPTLTCNPGVIRTHDDSITLEFELRPPPSLALDEVRKGVAALVRGVSAPAPGIRLELTEKRANPGFRSPSGSETVELAMGALARAGLPLNSAVKTGCTEAGIYAAAGLTPVVIGPGPSVGVIHAPNEYNLLSDVDAAVRFYRALLEL